MHAAVAAVRSQAGQARALALRADVYEEEDFIPHPFGFDFEPDASVEGVAASLAALDAAAEWLRAAKADGAADAPQQLPGLTQPLRAALGAHLALRAALLRAHAALPQLATRGSGGEAAAMAALADADAAIETLRACPPAGSSAEAPLPPGLAARVGFDAAVSRRLLGGALPRVIKLVSRAEALDVCAAHVSQLRAICAAPRELRSIDAMLAWLDAFSRDALPPPPGAAPRPAGSPLPRTLARSAALLALVPDATALVALDGVPLAQLMLADAWAPAAAGGVCPALDDAPPRVAAFFAAAARAAEGLLRALAANRARSRRRLRHVVAEWAPLCAAAVEAEAPPVCADASADGADAAAETLASLALVDGGISAADAPPSEATAWVAAVAGEVWGSTVWASKPLSAWAHRWVARVQAAHLEAGFALELYAPEEHCMLFWYLDYLDTAQLEAMALVDDSAGIVVAAAPIGAANAAAKRATSAREAAAAAAAAAAASPKDAKARKRSEVAAAASVAAFADARAAAAAAMAAAERARSGASRAVDAHRAVCRGYVRLYAGLRLAGKLPLVEAPFNEEFHRFWQRFGTFHNYATPAPLHHEQYESYIDPTRHAPPQLYGLARECFAAAAAAFKALAAEAEPASAAQPAEAHARLLGRDAASAARAAGAAAVAATLLERGAPLDVVIDAGAHRGWPALAVRAAK
jgi:hypothetical protein